MGEQMLGYATSIRKEKCKELLEFLDHPTLFAPPIFLLEQLKPLVQQLKHYEPSGGDSEP
jgi:hypothetical protein